MSKFTESDYRKLVEFKNDQIAELRARLERYKKALQFYAESGDWANRTEAIKALDVGK